MSAGDSLRRLGRFLEACERRTGSGVRLSDTRVSVTESQARAAVEVVVRADQSADALDVCDATLDDGALSLTLATLDDVFPADATGVSIDADGVSVGPGSALTVDLTVTVDADAPAERPPDAADAPASADGAPPRDPSVPPFEDRAHLTAIYDSCETFEEMSDAIDMDVTAETVRRYMIENGIHEAQSYDTASSGTDTSDDGADTPDDGATEPADERDDAAPAATSPEPPEMLADGLGLPEAVTLDELVDAVDSAKTIHQVGRDVGLDRMDALALLQRLDLLEFVMGRLSTEAEREAGRDQILERIRRSADAR